MFTIIYKSYPCAPGATLCSALCSCGTLLSVVGAVALIAGFFVAGSIYHEAWALIVGLLLAALAAFLYFVVYRKKIPEMAENQTQKNIRTKADAAYLFCQRQPEAYEELRAVNPAFAQKYERDETGRIVRRKK